MISVSVSADVPNLAEGVRFYDFHVDDLKTTLATAVEAVRSKNSFLKTPGIRQWHSAAIHSVMDSV